MNLDAVDTPCLCIDLDAFEANVVRMVALCRAQGIGWRPHSKGFKSVAVGKRLIEAGAIGLTCAKLGEAEVFGAAGIKDLLIANLVVGPGKVERLVKLRRIADPIVCFDHLDQAKPISEAMQQAGLKVRCLIDLEIGMHRSGVAPSEAVAFAKRLAELPGLELAGVMGYEGHLLLLADPAEKAAKIHAALDSLVATAESLKSAGLPCPIISCGGTGSLPLCAEHSGVTEVQAGGVMFMDRFYRERCHVGEFRNALFLISTVVSRPAPERAIIDAGRKTMNMELALPYVPGREDIRVKNLSAEHGILDLDPSAYELRIGDRLRFIPGYVDLTVVLHNEFLAVRGNRVEAVWPLEARGKLT